MWDAMPEIPEVPDHPEPSETPDHIADNLTDNPEEAPEVEAPEDNLAGDFSGDFAIDFNFSAIEHRDRVLRAYFEGRDWDENQEYLLKRDLVLNSDELLPAYPYLIEHEWEERGRTHRGRGDLVFTDGLGHFAIIEVKWLDFNRKGKNSAIRRNIKRKLVKSQAVRYAKSYLRLALKQLEIVRQVKAFTFTNEPPRLRLIHTYSHTYSHTYNHTPNSESGDSEPDNSEPDNSEPGDSRPEPEPSNAADMSAEEQTSPEPSPDQPRAQSLEPGQ